MDFEAELRELVLSVLPIKDRRAREQLETQSTTSVLCRFLAWRGRLVHPQPRRVHKSGQLLRNSVYQARRNEIHRMFAWHRCRKGHTRAFKPTCLRHWICLP